MLLLSVPFKDVFNYLIFKHAETIQIGERETGGVRAGHRARSDPAEAPGPPATSEAQHAEPVQKWDPYKRAHGKHSPRRGNITHRTYTPRPLARTEDPHARYSMATFISPLCSPAWVANLLLMSPHHDNWERSDIKSETEAHWACWAQTA